METGRIVRHLLVPILAGVTVSVITSVPTRGRAATAMVTITATVSRNLSVKTASELAFGALDTSASAGTIVLREDGGRVATGGAQLDQGATAGPAVLVVYGQPHSKFSLSVPASARIRDDAGATMVVDHFRHSIERDVELDGEGRGTIRIGATLHVRPNQPLGTYAGMMQVTVTYN